MARVENKNTLTTDFFFAVQLLDAIFWSLAASEKLLESTQGMALSYLLSFEGYVGLQILLLRGAHAKSPTRSTYQILAACWVWVIMLLACIATLLWRGYTWTLTDDLTATFAVVGGVWAWVWGYYKRVKVTDPMVKALFATVLKTTPQFFLAYKIFQEGNAGFSGITLLIGHLTITARVSQIWLDARGVGLDRNRKWLLVAEAGNWLSWLSATIVWLLRLS